MYWRGWTQCAVAGLDTGEALDILSSTSMTIDAVVRRAIRQAPCSIRALAREAGVSHAMLAAIVVGDERATLRVARRVARALDRWAARCAKDAAAVRTALAGLSGKGDA